MDRCQRHDDSESAKHPRSCLDPSRAPFLYRVFERTQCTRRVCSMKAFWSRGTITGVPIFMAFWFYLLYLLALTSVAGSSVTTAVRRHDQPDPLTFLRSSTPYLQRQFQANHERHENCWMRGAGFRAPCWRLCSCSGVGRPSQPATFRVYTGGCMVSSKSSARQYLSWSEHFALGCGSL